MLQKNYTFVMEMTAQFSKLRRSLLSDMQRVQQGYQGTLKERRNAGNKGRRSRKLATKISLARHFCVDCQIKSFLLLYCENIGSDQIVSYSED